MPLSEHEQQLLEQMEQALYAEDPKFASHMKGKAARSAARRRYVVGALGVVLGLGLVLVGVNTTMWVGVAGFSLMVAAAIYAFAPPRRAATPGLGTVRPDGTVGPPKASRKRRGGAPSAAPAASRAPKSGTFMQRMEARWERRRYDR